jgi:phosphate-selective porin OprO/OprP
MRYFRLFVFVPVLCALSSSFSSVSAQESISSDSLAQRLEAVDQQVRILARKIELEQEAVAAKAKDTAVLVSGKDGFSLKSADGKYQLKLRGYVQSDGRFFLGDEDQRLTNTFLMRRIRPILEGGLDKNFTPCPPTLRQIVISACNCMVTFSNPR